MTIHTLRTLIINAITLAVGVGLAANRRKNPDLVPRPWPPGSEAPYVQVIIPARDEERNVGELLDTLLRQSYPAGRWGVTLVDDGSTDRTAAIAHTIAAERPELRMVAAPPLPAGWTGKNHAMQTGFRSAPEHASWLLFVDADTRHHPNMLSTVVQHATDKEADLLSLVIDVRMDSFWERVLVPQVGELYTLLVGTMDQVNSRAGRAAANGQCMLVRRQLYEELGGLTEVRADVAEDRALAAAAKAGGYSVRLEYGRRLVSARVYSSFPDMWTGYSRTMFWASGHNLPRALAVALALALYALLPPLALLYALANRRYAHRRDALRHAPRQLLPMLALRAWVCRQTGVPAVYALAYPLAVAVGDAMLLFSVYRVVSGKGVQWKGRTYKREQ